MEIKIIINIILLLAIHVGLFGIFKKAGQNGFFAFIPFYNLWIWLKITERPWWWLILMLIPGVNIMMFLIMVFLTMRNFEVENTLELIVGVVFSPFYLIYLGFGGKKRFMGTSYWKNYPRTTASEWLEASVFAIVAATLIRAFFFEAFTIPTSSMEKSLLVGDYLFVSKISYGPKIPNTPLTIPFTHHTFPFTDHTPSYLEWIELPYFRLPGLGKVENNDIVVFNYPDGDTVALEQQNVSYYRMILEAGYQFAAQQGIDPEKNRDKVVSMGREAVKRRFTVKARPVDKRDNYVKRCVGIPGDLLEIRNQQLYVNGNVAENPDMMQFGYYVYAPAGLGKKQLAKLDLTDIQNAGYPGRYLAQLNSTNKEELLRSGSADSVVGDIDLPNSYDFRIFPNSPEFPWNKDNFGPLRIPAEGATVELSMKNLPLYARIIQVYENNQLETRDGIIMINGVASNTYTFKQNYYFLMGDNRHNSADSRFWGFVPHDHIVGKAVFIWMSSSSNRSFPNIRYERVFTFIGSKGNSQSYFFHIMIPLILLIVLYNKRKQLRDRFGR